MVFTAILFKPQKGIPTMVTPATHQVSTYFFKGFTLFCQAGVVSNTENPIVQFLHLDGDLPITP